MKVTKPISDWTRIVARPVVVASGCAAGVHFAAPAIGAALTGVPTPVHPGVSVGVGVVVAGGVEVAFWALGPTRAELAGMDASSLTRRVKEAKEAKEAKASVDSLVVEVASATGMEEAQVRLLLGQLAASSASPKKGEAAAKDEAKDEKAA